MSPKLHKREMFVDSSRKPYTAILRDKRRSGAGSSIGEWLAVLQGGYYVLSGLWPLVSMHSFFAVTGPKTDVFLVQVVATLIIVIGLVLIVAAVRSVLSLELALLMIGCALALGSIELIYTFKGVLPPIYFADAIEEFSMMLLCLAFLPRFTHRRHSSFI